jgi:hypothetical protein
MRLAAEITRRTAVNVLCGAAAAVTLRPISPRSGLPLLTRSGRFAMRQNVMAVTARAFAM